jgi:hypothetical protein
MLGARCRSGACALTSEGPHCAPTQEAPTLAEVAEAAAMAGGMVSGQGRRASGCHLHKRMTGRPTEPTAAYHLGMVVARSCIVMNRVGFH